MKYYSEKDICILFMLSCPLDKIIYSFLAGNIQILPQLRGTNGRRTE